MARVRTQVVRWESDDFPGWVEVRVRDAEGRTHRIVEKVAVLTETELTASTPFPFELWIDARAVDLANGVVSVVLEHGVEHDEGVGTLVMDAADVVLD